MSTTEQAILSSALKAAADAKAKPAKAEPSAPVVDDLSTLADALAPKKPDAETKPDPAAPKVKPKDLTEAAKALGIEVADLYALQIPSAREGAEPYTLGKLKDLAAADDDYTVRTLELEEKARKRESEVIRAEQDLQALIASLPKDAIKPEALNALKVRRDKAMSFERQRTLEVIPEWQDAKVRALEMEQLVEHLKDYGFPESYLEGVSDHRTWRYIRESWRREQQIRKALERVAERKGATPPKAKPQAERPAKQKSNGPMPYDQQQVSRFGNTITSRR